MLESKAISTIINKNIKTIEMYSLIKNQVYNAKTPKNPVKFLIAASKIEISIKLLMIYEDNG